MGNKSYEDLDSLVDEILTDAYGDEEQRWAFLQVLQTTWRRRARQRSAASKSV